jgi:hypothetical protein
LEQVAYKQHGCGKERGVFEKREKGKEKGLLCEMGKV